IHPDLKAALQRAVAEGLADHRATQTVQLPRQQRAGGFQVEDGAQRGTGAGKDNGALRQPLQRGRLIEIKVLVKAGLWAAAAIELTGAGHGDKRVAIGVQTYGNIQPVTAHHTARRVQQIKVAGFPFGVERTLYRERPDVVRGMEEGFLRRVAKPQVKRGLPAFVRTISDLSC